MTTRCVELVKKFEGFSSKPYLCPAGYWTIGYGKVLGKLWDDSWKDMTLTPQQAELLLIEDLMKYEQAILPLVKVKVHSYMMDALISFAYNVGVYALKSSTLRRKLNDGDFYGSADEFLRWIYASGKALPGLKIRRQAERELFLEGLKYMEI